jgi:hypothetical protein
VGAEYEIICSKAEKLGTYAAMGFDATGIKARYEKLNGAEHELLCHDFRESRSNVPDGFFRDLFCEMSFDEVVLPSEKPPVGLVAHPLREPLRLVANA